MARHRASGQKRNAPRQQERGETFTAALPRRWTPLSLALLAPLLLLACALSLGYLWNEDFWWYLTSGEAIIRHRGIPEQDPFLYTSAGESHWISHSWLWTVLVALLHRVAGLPGVLVFGAFLIAAVVVLVYTIAPVDRFGLTNGLLATAVLATAHQRLCLKAEVITWLLLIIFCWVLERNGPFSWRRGALLIALQVLWANLHGGYPLGIFAVAAYAVGSWIERRRLLRGGASAAPVEDGRFLLRLAPLLVFASLAQPSLLHGQAELLASLLGSTAASLAGVGGEALVLEWQPVFPSADLSIRATWVLLVAVGLLSFRAARGRHSWSRLLLLAGLAALAVTAIRHLTGLAIGAAFVTIANLGESTAEPLPRTRRLRRPVRMAHAAGALGLGAYLLTAALGLWLARADFDNGSGRDSFFAINPRSAAPRAADFLLRARPPGPIFNDFATGGYLAWRLFPSYQLFIDSRILDSALVLEYKRMLTYPSAWERAQARYGFRTAVLGNFSKTLRSPLGQALRNDPDWRLVFLDPQAAVFVRDESTAATLTVPDTIPAETARVPYVERRSSGIAHLARLASRPFLRQYASHYLIEYLAILGSFGHTRATEDFASAALSQNPEDPLLLRQRCAARFVRGYTAGALEDCAAAYRLRADDVGILTLYALVLGQQGKKSEARRLVDQARLLAPGDPQVANAAAALR